MDSKHFQLRGNPLAPLSWGIAIAVFLLNFLLLRPVQAQETTVSAEIQTTPTSRIRVPVKGLNLSTIRWYASADLTPDSPPDIIRTKGTPTTPTVVLRSGTYSHSGILFALIDLPAGLPPETSARITMGDIDGEDDTFFNGVLIGQTRGWGVSNNGRPRLYTIPAGRLKAGINVLAVRIIAFRDRETFGIRSTPLTFALNKDETDPLLPVADAVTSRGYSGLDKNLARNWIAQADPETTAEIIQRRRPGFGRFGVFENNGLPMVSDVSPTQISTRGGATFEVALDKVTKLTVADSAIEPGIDTWHKTTRVAAVSAGKPVTYTLKQSLLFPGAIISLESGDSLQLQVRAAEEVAIKRLSDEEKQIALPKAAAQQLEAYVVYPVSNASTPALLLCRGLAVNINRSENQIGITLAQTGKERGKMHLCYPAGLYRSGLGGNLPTMESLADAVHPDRDSTSTLTAWMRLGLWEPEVADEYFAVIPGDKVQVYQTVRYRSLVDKSETSPILFAPPQVDFLNASYEMNTNKAETSSTGMLAFSGEVRERTGWSQPAETESVRNTVLQYSLKLPPVRERGLIEAKAQTRGREFLRKFALTDLGTSLSRNAVDAIYKSRTQGYQAYSWLDDGMKQLLRDSDQQTIRQAMRDDMWTSTTEPLTGMTALWTYYIQGPYFQEYDQDWGNGLALYGFQTAVKYAGRHDWAEEYWPDIARIFEWFTIADDWEWMRASNAFHGHGTGAGDCHSVTYVAAIAYIKLAQLANKPEEENYGWYLAARSAVLSLNRFSYNQFASSQGFISGNAMVLGFHEGDGFLQGDLEGYSWNVTSNISGNGVQPENFDLYLMYGRNALRSFEQQFERHFPHWSNGKHDYGSSTLYRGNSGYITLPHIYLRARLQEYGVIALSDYIAEAATNLYLWWLAPPVIAESMIGNADNIFVTEWGKCAFLGGTVEALKIGERDRRHLSIRFEKGDAPETIRINLPKQPIRVLLNRGPVPLTDSRYLDGELVMRLRRSGINTVDVYY